MTDGHLDQKSFEAGLKIGLMTAKVILRDARTIPDAQTQVETHIAEMKGVERRRGGHHEGVAGDLFLPIPLGSAADLGLPASDAHQTAVALSKMRWDPLPAIVDRNPKGEDALAASCEA